MNSSINPYLLINPVDQTITPVYYDGDLSSLYAMLNCDLVTVAPCGSYDLFVDDEGLLKDDQSFFLSLDYAHQPLAGMAMAVGVDEEGNTVPPNITLEELQDRVFWINYFDLEGEA